MDFQEKIINLLSSSNLKEDFDKLTYDEKVMILSFESPFLDILIDNIRNLGISFFNREESLRLVK